MGTVIVVADVKLLGGARPPDAEVRARIHDVVQEHLGKTTGARLTHRYEVLLR